MNIDPLLEIEHRFRYDFKGKNIADLLKSGAELIGGPEGCADFIAYELHEVPPDKIHAYDLVLMRDYDRDKFQLWSATAWIMLKPGGWLYVGSAGSVHPRWAGWQPHTWETSGSEMHSIFIKKIPDGFPFKIGTSQDTVLFTVKKTDRKTKRKPQEIGKDHNGLIVKWFLTDCTLYLRRPAFVGPYRIFDIGPREVKYQREQKESVNGRLALERNRA